MERTGALSDGATTASLLGILSFGPSASLKVQFQKKKVSPADADGSSPLLVLCSFPTRHRSDTTAATEGILSSAQGTLPWTGAARAQASPADVPNAPQKVTARLILLPPREHKPSLAQFLILMFFHKNILWTILQLQPALLSRDA